jgi:hypothetical protein
MYVLLYQDGTHQTHLDRLIKSIQKHSPEIKIILFDKKNIDPVFIQTHKQVFDSARGGGYWIWKPYILYETLKILDPGETLLYIDSKYEILEPITDWLSTKPDLCVWKNKPNSGQYFMKNWCKMDVIDRFDMFDKVFVENAEDCWAGMIFVRKTEQTLAYVEEWLSMCNYENISDSPSQEKNAPMFTDHRHDQSLLSIVLHKHQIPMEHLENKYIQDLRNPF